MRAASLPKLSIIVVSYNTRDMTLACLDSIYQQTRTTKFEVLVVDNASSDRSADAIARHPMRPKLMALENNLGFARANNLAAREANGEFLLLLNPDVIVKNGAIDALMAFAQKKTDAGIWGGRTVFADGSLNPSSCWGRMTPWNLFCRATGLTGLFPKSEYFNGEAYGGWQRNSIREVDIVSGCFFLIQRKLWDRLGGFDPLFFMYGEEADLCLRAAQLGAQPAITPNATIIHFGGASETAHTAKMIKLLSAKASLIKRHWHPRLVSLGLALNAAWPWSRWLALRAGWLVLGRPEYRDRAATWQEIWRARHLWAQGYDQTSNLNALDGNNIQQKTPVTTSRCLATNVNTASPCTRCDNPGPCQKMLATLKEA